ncbi:hypothetical protein KY284_000808 [Solanum tuberosum]|nr:hypothetical protein KY284_000808 [Solanum tuberosum]
MRKRTSTVKKADTTKGKENYSQKRREPSKRKRETSHVLKQNSEQGLGMGSLADLVELQSWSHLFMKNLPFYMNNKTAGKILEVPREGTRYVVGKLCTKEYVKKCSKLPDMRHVGVQKKLMKGEYQVLFEFVNKVLLPRPEKRTVASATDLFVMESLNKFEPLNLQALMLDHMYKTIIKHKGKHGMGYRHFLTKVFKYLNIPVGLGTIGTAKQSFSLNSLVVSECIEGRAGPLSKMLQLAQLLKVQTEGPGTEVVKELRLQNAALLAQNASI